VKKKIITAIALLALAWAGIFGLAACGKHPEPVKVQAPYTVTPTAKQAEVKVIKKRPQRRVVHKAAAPTCTSSFLGIPTC
jgi:hypothetical protein